MLLFGVIAESQWNSERIMTLKPGESVGGVGAMKKCKNERRNGEHR